MIGVFLLAALLAAASVWFLARAVRDRPAPAAHANRDALEQLRDRLLTQLRELDVEEADRNIDKQVAGDERKRIEAELAQVLRSLENESSRASRPVTESASSIWPATVFILGLLLPLVSASLYFLQNGSVLRQLDQPPQAVPAARGEVPPMARQMVARLEQRLKEEPNDPQGWARLGRSYDVLGREDDARRAYARAYKQAPENAEIIAAYAGFLMSREPSSMSSETVSLFRKLHTLEPQHPGALWALGFAAYQQQNFSEAVSYWDQLLKLLPPDSQVVPQLRHALDIARAEAAKAKK
jgi:cytochrome c-type biogenesis protein CcmH